MRYWVASGLLIIGFICNKLLGISIFEGIVVGLMALVAFSSEKLLHTYAAIMVLMHKKILTTDDFQDFVASSDNDNDDK